MIVLLALRESPIKRPENPFKPVVSMDRVVTIDDIRSPNTLDLTYASSCILPRTD